MAKERDVSTTLNSKVASDFQWDFEMVLLHGLLGFGLSICVNTVIIVYSFIMAPDKELACLYVIIVALVASVLLRVVKICTDWFERPSAKRLVRAIYVVAMALAIVGAFFQWTFIAMLCAGLSLIAISCIYGKFLGILPRNHLMLVINISFIGVSFLLILGLQLVFWQTGILFASIALLSAFVTIITPRRGESGFDTVEFGNAKESRARSIHVRGNNHTLFMMGFFLASLLLLRRSTLPEMTVCFILCVAIGAAGIAHLVFGFFDQKKIFDTILKMGSLMTVIFLAPIPFIDGAAATMFLGIFAFYVCVNVAIIIQAMIETVRFNQLSPYWLFGKEGSIFFLGFSVGAILFTLATPISEVAPYGFAIVIYVAVVAGAYMQIPVNYQVYPFEPVIDMSEEEKVISEQVNHSVDKRMSLWRKKQQYASDQHALSPREREILEVLLKGRDAKYIMSKFYISQSTAKTHIYNIYKKFDVHSRQELIDYVESIEVHTEELEGAPMEHLDDRYPSCI